MPDATALITAYFAVLSAVLGLVMGSFANCMAWRITHGESVMKGRSHCAVCGHTLSARDLVPALSYIFLRGRCRYCGERIAPRYMAAELVSMAAFLSAFLRFGVSLETLQYMALAVLLLSASLTDLDDGLIPDRLVIAGIAVFAAFTPFISDNVGRAYLNGLIGGLSVSVPVLIIVIIMDKVLKRESMGGGDIKLLFMLGLYFDWKYNILILILACVIGLLSAFALKSRSGEGKGEFPFGPSICIAAWLTLLFGNIVMDWYLGLF